LALVGDLEGARRALEAKWRFFSLADDQDARAMNAAEELARFCCDTEQWGEAEQWLALHRHIGRETHHRHSSEARLAAHRGEHDRALALTARVLELRAGSDALNDIAADWLAVAEVRRAAGDAAAAQNGVVHALAAYEAKGNVTGALLVRMER